MLSHLYADVVEEEGSGSKGGGKKKGGSMQTISATHRVSIRIQNIVTSIFRKNTNTISFCALFVLGTITQIND